MNAEIAKFNFSGYIIKKSLFEITDKQISNDLTIGIGLEGLDRRSDRQFDLTMELSVKDQSQNLNVEVVAVGNFIFDDGCEEQELGNYFSVNAPAILFPYLRAHIATISTLCGLDSPLKLPTLNLSRMAGELIKNTSKG